MDDARGSNRGRRRGGRAARQTESRERFGWGAAVTNGALTDQTLTDEALTEDEIEIGAGDRTGEGKTLLIACGALAREVLAVTEANQWSHLELQCLPAKLHNQPQFIPDRVREKIVAGRRAGFDAIYVLYADCGTGGLLDKVCDEAGVERIAGPHCYSFFEGNEAFAERSETEITAFYLTDFLVRQFDTLVWRGMGFDRAPELVETMFGNYEKIVYLAQTDDPALDAKAQAAAQRLGLAYERRMTGFGDLARFMESAATRETD